MRKKAATRLPILLVIAWAMWPAPMRAQDLTLRDAIQCKDFKRNSDGSWFAEDVSVAYGPGKSTQFNLFGPTTIRKGVPVNGTDLWAILTAKCGS